VRAPAYAATVRMRRPLSHPGGLRLVGPTSTPTLDGSEPPVVVHAVGGRSDAVRLAPVMAALERRGAGNQVVVGVGDAVDCELIASVAADVGLPARDHTLADPSEADGVGAALTSFHELLSEVEPQLVVLAGERDAVLACALAAARRRIAVAHLESGLRSWDWAAPEEVNRVVIDRLSDTLFTHSEEGSVNLRGEGVPDGRVHAVGSTAVDALRRVEARARARAAWAAHGLAERGYVLVTLHRDANLAGADRVRGWVEALAGLATWTGVVFCLHPRTRARLSALGALPALHAAGVGCVSPQGYVDFVSLQLGAGAIVTDSYAVQEEASALGVRCFTLAAVSERPTTLAHGTNVLLGEDPSAIAAIVPGTAVPTPRPVPLWDGHAAERVADVLVATYALAEVSLACT
jgi:UDP-N-acetylglucosamine 2-epimerase (non-hydrolysing)